MPSHPAMCTEGKLKRRHAQKGFRCDATIQQPGWLREGRTIFEGAFVQSHARNRHARAVVPRAALQTSLKRMWGWSVAKGMME
ncbi:hypothetical protein TRAPUB_10824 [Trametes pubescens]|uniref:Uncharacterized protein n=1 Tax=Trametes pubescens TaxID=154538 RepID=A0A1M2VYC7_TRAPU|nr:hypothetical protein TRAPUB_10824 [Trametes pubescens]